MTTRERFLRPLGRRKFKTPRAIVFAPYLNTLGGGERVIVAVAQLLQQSFAVALSGPRERDLGRWRGLGFPEMSVAVRSARQFTRETIRASLAVTMTNHVPLPSFAHRSFLIVQFPTDQIADFPAWKRVAGRWSLRRYSLLTYSQFNASFIEQRWGTADVVVLPPPVRQFPYEEAAKTNSILSVGRFTTSGNHKRQDALLEAWARLRPTLPTWHLVLAGAGSEDAPHVKQLRVRADEIGGVTIHVDATADLIAGLYQTASIYWHAAGYERPDDRPEKAEHFGMSTVEAMSAGAVPIVFRDGGQTEVVEGTAGVCWTNIDDLVAATEALAIDPLRLRSAASNVSRAAAQYSPEVFNRRFLEIVGASRRPKGRRWLHRRSSAAND